MNVALAARLARRELRGGVRGFRVFLACLALGVAAIAAVGSVRQGIEAGLEREGAVLLGGDAEIELTYRFASVEERAFMDGFAETVSETADFRSMVVVGEGLEAERALTQVRAVDGAYPIYGEVGLAPEMPLETALAGRDGLPGMVMAPLLMDRLGIAPGAVVRLGTQDFALMAALAHEPDGAASGFSLGPRSLVSLEGISGAGLLQPGTLFETEYRLRLPKGTDLEAAETATRAAFGEVGLRWSDSRNGAPGLSRFVERLGAFLVLVGLAGLAVGGVGIAAAVRAYLARKTETIATLSTLGAHRSLIFLVYFMQVGALAIVGIAMGLALGAVLPLAVAPIVAAQLPVPVAFAIYPAALGEAALYGVLASVLFTLWPLARTEEVRAAALYREARTGAIGWPRLRYVLASLALILVLVGAAAMLTGTARLTFWAAGGIGAAFVTLLLAAWVIRRLAAWLAHRPAFRGRPALRMAFGAVGGPGGDTTSVVLSLGLGLSVLAAVGQIDANLRGAISRELPKVAPSYFIVDIQNDQIGEFTEALEANAAVSRYESAPMLRGVITKINDRPAQEVAGGHWVVRGDRGITYAEAKPENTTVTEGAWWPEGYDGPPLISFAAEEAEEMGLSIGDTMVIDVLGREIEGTIASFRAVDFSGAGMGFVLSMNPAALAGAPHTHIATIYAEEAAEPALLRQLASTWPNITAIRVRDAIDRVSSVMQSIAAATTLGALATLVTGGVVLIGTAAAAEQARVYEAAVLKTLGASRLRILTSFVLRSVLMGTGAALVAIGAGAAAGWAVMRFVMESDYIFAPGSALVVVFGGVAITLLAGAGFSLRSLSARPSRVLRARD